MNTLSAHDRDFYFHTGDGFADVQYPSGVHIAVNDLAIEPGVTRGTISLNLCLGYAVTRNLYVTGLITGVGDRLAESSNYFQLNTYVYGIGVQGYPFGTGLQLGAHVGPAIIVFQSDFAGNDTTPGGFGSTLSAAWDFACGPTGPSALLGRKTGTAPIEDEITGFTSLFISFVYK